MLHSYRFSNHYSFRQPTDVSLVLDGRVPDTDRSIVCSTGQRLSKVLAILGANGSGKTNLLKPLAFLNWFVQESFRAPPGQPIPLTPHFFSEDQTASFEVEFDAVGTLWRYALTATPERVLSETLHRRTARFSYVFQRTWESSRGGYDVRQQDFGFNVAEARKVGEKVSMLSAALQYQVPLAHELLRPSPIVTNIVATGRDLMGLNHVLQASQQYGANAPMALRMSELLHDWDLGLERVELRKQKIQDALGQEQEIFVPWGVHAADGRTADIQLAFESSGTQSAFVLLSRLLPVLDHGGVAVIDELESDLHPTMLTPILDLFLSPATNPKNAQLLFTTHATPILNELDKGQIMLVEKDEHCDSHAYRLDSVRGVRADDNLYAKYMTGTYGAVPDL